MVYKKNTAYFTNPNPVCLPVSPPDGRYRDRVLPGPPGATQLQPGRCQHDQQRVSQHALLGIQGAVRRREAQKGHHGAHWHGKNIRQGITVRVCSLFYGLIIVIWNIFTWYFFHSDTRWSLFAHCLLVACLLVFSV